MPEPITEPNSDTRDNSAPYSNAPDRGTPASQAATKFSPSIKGVRDPGDPAGSTPGPDAPERVTHPESTEQVAQQRAAERRLPPIPGYDVQQFIGRGGMGMVYRAVHRATGRTVALKLVNPSGAQDPISRERFDREVRALAALKHPNIVPIYDADDWHGFPYCAMEFVAGGALDQHLGRLREDLRGAVRIMAKTARAVAAMHAAGVLHRDLKPQNILVGPNDEPMVADFGLVRGPDDHSELTYTGAPIGTRQYMAPEQTLGRRSDYTPACDIWALGVTLYEILTGSRPFPADGNGDLFTRIRNEEEPPIAELAPAVPAELAAVARKCLKKRPEERYTSAAALADDLERWLAGTPVSATPVPPPTHAPAKKLGRVRVVFVIASAVLLAVFATQFRSVPAAPVPPEPVKKKTLAERVAAGEKVKLTDEKGVPTVPLIPVGGHELAETKSGDYHGFLSLRTGLAGFADEPWEGPIRIEAVVSVRFSTVQPATGGVYFARRQRTDIEYETLAWCGVHPRFDAVIKLHQVGCANGFYSWPTNQAGGLQMARDEKFHPWSTDGTLDLRFVPIIAEVREKEVRTTVDGEALLPLTEQWVLRSLNVPSPGRPKHTFTPPTFGTGIGVFCRNAECIVLNLTVSKLDP